MIKIFATSGKVLTVKNEEIVVESEIIEKDVEYANCVKKECVGIEYNLKVTGFLWEDKNYNWFQRKIIDFLLWLSER